MSATRRPVLVAALTAAVIALVSSAAVAVGAVRGPTSRPAGVRGLASPGGQGLLSGSPRSVPKLPGTVVNISLTNMGGPMMGGQGNAMMGGGAMSLTEEQASVPRGTVSFVVTNAGSLDHEMVILRLPSSKALGTRPIGVDAKIDETGSLGEASKLRAAAQAPVTESPRVPQAG